MNDNIKLKHVALHSTDKEKSDMFFKNILNMEFQKKFTLDSKLSEEIFGLNENVEVCVYGHESLQFEIFITKSISDIGFNHVCIEVDSKKDLINACDKYNARYFFVQKGDKKLLFIQDLSGNLYEIKEKL